MLLLPASKTRVIIKTVPLAAGPGMQSPDHPLPFFSANKISMQFLFQCIGRWPVMMAFAFMMVTTTLHHPDSSLATTIVNDKELSLPLLDKKLVMAHCMPNILRFKGHKLEDSCDPEFYAPSGNSTAPIGGLTQVNVLTDSILANASLDEAVALDLKAAISSGIDGFQFYYTLGNEGWDVIINSYLRMADSLHLDFKFTFCISHPSGGDENSRLAEFARRINRLLDAAGRTNPHWLRTPDGRLIIYTWYGDTLADIPTTGPTAPTAFYAANAYRKLGQELHEKLACIISINEQITRDKLNSYLDYFPAVWLWTLPYTDHYIGNMVADQCKKRKRTFTGSAFPDFYTSKLIRKGTWDMYHYAGEAVAGGLKNSERKYIVTGLSYNFRKQLEFCVERDVPMINIITWNDYPEGHHLAPEGNHNDGFSLLLRYYKQCWKKESLPAEDIIIAFYKKYRQNIHPSPFDFPVVEIEKPGVDRVVEDSIEIVSILSKPATLSVNNKAVPVAAGLVATHFAGTAGPVTATLQRSDSLIKQLICPEWITDQPYRTDRLTYSFSTQTQSTWKTLLGVTGDQRVEYNPSYPGNHISFYQPQENKK